MKYILIVLFLSCLFNCKPYHKTNRIYKIQARALAKTLRQIPTPDSLTHPHWIGTTNFNLRKPNFVIIHHTAQNSCDSTLRTFTLIPTQVSAHYVICKDGTIHHMLNDYFRAWHAGISKWGTLTDLNSSSIGIELDNNGFEPFPDPQLNSLIRLLDTLKRKYSIPVSNFLGHSDISPRRKVDPNIYFPWKLLADCGFGNWYDDTTMVQVPSTFNFLQGLRTIGYEVTDSIAVIISFKRHFVQDTSRVFNDRDKKILFNLLKKY